MISIIGNGPAAVSAVEAIRSVDKDIPIRLFSAEKYPAYAPNCMENVIREDISEEALFFKGGFEFYKKHNVELLLETPIVEVDPTTKSLKTKKGDIYTYDKCLISVGAYPFMPPIDGINLDGVFGAKSLDDAKNIKSYLRSNRVENIVVVGAGPIGIEDAQTLFHMGYNVSVIEIFDRILPRMLDHQMSYIYQQALEEEGIKFYTAHQLLKIEGNKKVNSVIIKDLSTNQEKRLKAELVIISVGVRPILDIVKNVEIHKKDGKIIGGILTNEYQETSAKDLYAAGDVCSSLDIWKEHRWIALFPAAVQEGFVAGFNMAGKKVVNTGSVDYNAVKTKIVTAGSGGVFENADKSITFEHDGVFFKVFIKNDMIVGYQFVGYKTPIKPNRKNKFLNYNHIKMGGLGLEASGVIMHTFMRAKKPLTSFMIKALKLGNLRGLADLTKDIPLWM